MLALVSARDSNVKHDSESGGLIWVEGWYQGLYGKFHLIIHLSHILHWLFFQALIFKWQKRSLNWQIAKNKSLRELHLFNLQIFLFRVLYNDVRKCLQNIPKTLTFEWTFLFMTMQTFKLIIPFQVIYNFIPIFWNVLIWLKYDFIILPCTLTYFLWNQAADARS
jgi:hypothetical protein